MTQTNFTRRRTRSVYRERSGRQLHWLESGDRDAQPLVLFHGFMAHSMAYRRVAAALSEHYRLLIPDLPAHGRDESYRHASVHPTIDSLAEWTRLFRREALGESPAHWVGHSLGASLVYSLALTEPDYVRSLTLVSPGLRIPGSRMGAFALDRLPASVATLGANRLGLSLYQPLNWRGEPMTPAECEEYLRPMRSRRRMQFILRLGARLLEGNHLDLHPLDLPTLILWGEHDHILPLEDAWWLSERLHADLHIVDGSGHSPMEDTPELFTQHLLDFLPKARREAARKV